MSDETFYILRTAVNVARDRQIGRLATLRSILSGMFPGKDEQISEALSVWATYASAHR